MSTDKKDRAAPDDATVVVSARLFAAVAAFRASHDIRYYLCGVHVTPCEDGGVFIVATNGHQMGVAHDPDGRASEPVILACSKALEAAARDVMHGDDAIVVLQDKHVRLLAPNELFVQAGTPLVIGKFPDFLKVLEGGVGPLTSGISGVLSGVLVKRLGKVAELLSAKFCSLYHWTTEGNYVLTRFGAEKQLTVVTMPLRDDPPADGPLAAALAGAVSKAKAERLANEEASAALAAKAENTVNADAQPA